LDAEKKKRHDLKANNKSDFMEENKHKRNQESKKTYPMCMQYYEPANIAIFGLVSREV